MQRVPAIAVHREQVPRFHFHGGLWLILSDAAATGGDLGCVEAIYERGATLPRRIHTREDEFYYVLAGQITVALGDESPRVAAEGAFVFVPRGTSREVRVISDVSRIYQCLIPAGFEAIIQRRGLSTHDLTPPDRANQNRVSLDTTTWQTMGVLLTERTGQ